MMTTKYFISQSAFIVLILIFSIGISTLKLSAQDDCADDFLGVYPDSLDFLTLSHQLEESTRLADSLLLMYGHLNCPNVVLIKAAQARTYEHHVDFESALEIYNKVLETAQNFEFIAEEITIRLSLARVYETIARPELSKEQLERVEELINIHQLNQYLPRYYVRLTSYIRIYVEEDKAKAIKYAEEAIILGEKYGDDKSIADAYLLLGILTEDIEASIIYFKKASNLLFQLGDYIGAMFQERNLARVLLIQGNYQNSLDVLQDINLDIVNYSGQKKMYYRLQKAIIDVKAQAFEGLGKKDSVINYLKEYNKYSRLLEDYVNQEKINQLVIENVVRQEQEKIAAAKKQNRMLFFGIILLLGIILLIFRLYILNRRKSQQINKQSQTISQNFAELQKLYNYQSTLFSEVHHRIKNNLQLIISLMTLQKAKLSNVTEQKFLSVLSHRVNSIALIHDQLYSLKEFEKVDVGLYFNALLKNMIALRLGHEVQVEQEVDVINLNLETITPLGLIWSELISNSLKYNSNGNGLKIYFKLNKKDDTYFMHYYDNGKGYPEDEFLGNAEGIGYTIIQSLSRQLAAKTNSYNASGAHFTMEFKEKTISPL